MKNLLIFIIVTLLLWGGFLSLDNKIHAKFLSEKVKLDEIKLNYKVYVRSAEINFLIYTQNTSEYNANAYTESKNKRENYFSEYNKQLIVVKTLERINDFLYNYVTYFCVFLTFLFLLYMLNLEYKFI